MFRPTLARLLGVLALLAGLAWWAAAGGRSGAPELPAFDTIVVVTIDTLRRDAVGAYAPHGTEPPRETPHLDAFALRATRFDDARTVVPLTLPAHVAMFTGLPPVRTGVRVNASPRLVAASDRAFPLLAERLHAEGWHTAAFVSASVLGAMHGLDQGFDRYDDGQLEDRGGPAVVERAGAVTVARALAHLAARPAGAPVFLWVHLFEPHAPHASDGTYAGDVRTADAAVGTLLAGLARRGEVRTAVIILGDHGEGLGELGEREHGFLLADGVLRIPLLLRVPDREPSVRPDPVQITDVAPTVAALADLAWPAQDGPGVGRDLLGPPEAARVLVAESVYGHHLHRWAQLVGAADARGTLVDAGRDRLHVVPPAPYGHLVGALVSVPDGPWATRLARETAAYKRAECDEHPTAGPLSPYGGQGPVAPFLTPEMNALRPDPYASVQRHDRIESIRQLLLRQTAAGEAEVEEALRSARAMDRPDQDAGSPELQFWIGEASYQLGQLRAGSPGGQLEARTLLEAAEAHFLRAFELGYRDTTTLVRACGVNSLGRETECLERFETLAPQVEPLGAEALDLRERLRAAIPR